MEPEIIEPQGVGPDGFERADGDAITTIGHVTRSTSPLLIAAGIAAIVGLVALVAFDPGETSDAAADQPSSSFVPSPSTIPESVLPVAPRRPAPADGLPVMPSLNPPEVVGRLADDTPFRVYELTPGVLCAQLSLADRSPPTNGLSVERPDEICHHEHVTASGPAVLGDQLVFGYLWPKASSTMLRYRSGVVNNDGIRVEQDARFFALPIVAGDPYRLQYRSDSFTTLVETPLRPYAAGDSQDPEPAAEQGVPRDIAGLPMIKRLRVIDEWPDVDNGPFVVSRLRPRDRSGCDGDGPAPYCQANWFEFIKLDERGTEIGWAVPLPHLRPRSVLHTRDATFILATSERPRLAPLVTGPAFYGLIRIDRFTGDYVIRLLPNADADPTAAEGTMFELPLPDVRWSRGTAVPEIGTELAQAEDGTLLLWPAVAGDGWLTFDPDTLRATSLAPLP